MVGISQYELTVEVDQLLWSHGLESSLSTNRHEHWSVDSVVGETHLSNSSLRVGTFCQDLERQGASTHIATICHFCVHSTMPRVYGHAQLCVVPGNNVTNCEVDGLYLE